MRALALAAGVLLALVLGPPASAAIAISATGTLTQCGAATTCELPTATNSAGHLVAGFCGGGTTGAAMTYDINETGFGDDIDSVNNDGTDSSFTVEFKVSGGSEPANLTCDSNTAAFVIGQSFAFAGVDAAILDAATVLATADDNTDTFATPAIVTVTANAEVWSCIHKNGGHSGSFTQPSGYTLRIDPNSATQNNNPRIGCASKLVVSPGTETPGTWGGISGGASDWDGFTFALRAAADAAAVARRRHE